MPHFLLDRFPVASPEEAAAKLECSPMNGENNHNFVTPNHICITYAGQYMTSRKTSIPNARVNMNHLAKDFALVAKLTSAFAHVVQSIRQSFGYDATGLHGKALDLGLGAVSRFTCLIKC
jgi:hypothetical protein